MGAAPPAVAGAAVAPAVGAAPPAVAGAAVAPAVGAAPPAVAGAAVALSPALSGSERPESDGASAELQARNRSGRIITSPVGVQRRLLYCTYHHPKFLRHLHDVDTGMLT